jgi:hypothetical protein
VADAKAKGRGQRAKISLKIKDLKKVVRIAQWLGVNLTCFLKSFSLHSNFCLLPSAFCHEEKRKVIQLPNSEL